MDASRPPQGTRPDDDDSRRLTELLLSTDTFDTFLTELVAYAQTQTEHSSSITVSHDGRPPYTVVTSDDLALRLDEEQYAVGHGPCLEALATLVPVLVTDMATETRWAPYPARASALGARSSMSYPLIAGEQALGALNLYAFEPVSRDAGLQARALQLADRAAGALAVGLRIAEDRSRDDTLREALSSRSVVDQAIGILMAQQRCSVEDAFSLLRQASQGRGLKLRDVAGQIVASAQRRAPGKGGGRY